MRREGADGGLCGVWDLLFSLSFEKIFQHIEKNRIVFQYVVISEKQGDFLTFLLKNVVFFP